MFTTSNLTSAQAQILVLGLHTVARADGISPQEDELIKAFYEGCRSDGLGPMAAYDDLVKASFEPDAAKQAFNTPELRSTFVQACVFLGFADGSYSVDEKASVRNLASAVGLNHDAVSNIESLVHDHLMGQFKDIQNMEALVEIAKETRPN
ncbi:MAG: TerB family tellurite resistance protein [Pseudomonadota bacterium]|nr:TerB family tellurite resistance protein [Pseudomonadota bacterium]